jgi:hypothetical protein
VPSSARSLSTRRLLPALAPRRLLLALGSTAIISAGLLSAAAPANAVVVKTLEGTHVGVQPHSSAAPVDGNGTTAASFENVSGNPVLHTNSTYAIYWDPDDAYHGDWQHLINHFLQSLGAESGTLGNVFAVDTQYTDKSNRPAAYASTFMGAYTDTNPYPSAYPAAEGCKDPKPLQSGDAITCITDKQVREQLQTFITTQHDLAKGMGRIFYLLTPPGVAVCLEAGASPTACSSDTASSESFCSYHSAISPTNPVSGDENTLLYAVIPWVAGGFGDYHMTPTDQKIPAYECQDGGYNPTGKPIEQSEKAKERTKTEEEVYNAGNTEEKAAIKAQEAREGPHAEEPNQDGIGPDGSPDTGLADVIVSQIAAEQQNTVTDPLLNAWQDSAHNEATDECRNFFATGSIAGSVSANELTGAGTLSNQTLGGNPYYVNDAFNLAALRLPYPAVPCLTAVNLVPQFTAPNPVKANELVGFDGMESDIALNAAIGFSAGGSPQANYATYTWNFGDGTPAVSGYAPGAPACSTPWLSPCAAGEYHAYQYGGTYPVTLTVTDVGGNVASVTNSITVTGPPPPGSASSGGSGGSAAGGSATAPVSSPAAPAAASVAPGPVATASALSKSLASALTSGLVVRYSVSEQVAGHFEVLLAASVARKIGLHGAAATGLAKGTPAQIVIGKDILVTTRGGSNTVKIKFSKSTAARLRRLHKVSVMLRLVVRNASKSPATTTTLSTATLTG